MIPTTLEECMEALSKELTPAEQITLMKCTKDDLVKYHHSLGQWIRNYWGLWTGGPLNDSLKEMGFTHPDDSSNSIIKEFWCRLNKQPSEIQDDIEYYKKFWADQENK